MTILRRFWTMFQQESWLLLFTTVAFSIIFVELFIVDSPVRAFSLEPVLSRNGADSLILIKSEKRISTNSCLGSSFKQYNHDDHARIVSVAAPTPKTTTETLSMSKWHLYSTSSSSDTETKVQSSSSSLDVNNNNNKNDGSSSKTELTRLKLKMNEISRSMDDAETRAEQAEREMETLRSKIKNAEKQDGETKNGSIMNILEDGSISAVLQEANEAIAESRRAIEATGESAEQAIDEAESVVANMKSNDEQKLWAAKRDLKGKLDELEREKQALQLKFWDMSEEKNSRIVELETEMEMERKAAELAEERTKMIMEERYEMEKRKDSMLQEQQLKKDMELDELRMKLELATIKKEEERARVLALRSSKIEVQQAMKDHITSLQDELRSYESAFLKIQKEADIKYEKALKQQREQSKSDMDELLARQEELIRQQRNELIDSHQKQINQVYGKLEKAKLTVERLQSALDQARVDSKEKIASLVKENTKRMEELVEQYESDREVMVQEFSDTLALQDEAIEELQSLNNALNKNINATKESHAKEIESLQKQFLSQRLQDKAEAERKRADILRRHVKVLSEKNAIIAFYEEERNSIRKMMKQSYKLVKGRVKRRIPWNKETKTQQIDGTGGTQQTGGSL